MPAAGIRENARFIKHTQVGLKGSGFSVTFPEAWGSLHLRLYSLRRGMEIRPHWKDLNVPPPGAHVAPQLQERELIGRLLPLRQPAGGRTCA